MKKFLAPQILTVSFVIVITGILGSLYFSEIERYLPCDLCWYQRVLLYPNLVLYAVALWRKEYTVYIYSLPLLIIGWLIAAYHSVMYYLANFSASEIVLPCRIDGPSCTARYIELFGFVSIPLMSLLAFTVLIVLMIWLKKASSK